MSRLRQGEVWWGESPTGKGRPYLVVSRNQVIDVLRAVLVVPVTRTIRSIPTELALGPEEGLLVDSAAPFDNLRPFDPALLIRRLGSLDVARRQEFCAALRAAADC